METYSVSLLHALASRYPENQYVVFVNRLGSQMPALDAPNITPVVCDFDATRRGLRYLWEHAILPRLIREHGLDVVHSTGYQGPVRVGCPSVVSIPDVNFRAVADMFPWYHRAALRFFCERAARQASRVITISQFSKSEIVRYLRIPEEKIDVTHLACSLPASTGDEDVREIYKLPAQYVVTFGGNSWPHKNLPALFEAMELVREEMNLVIIGRLSPGLCKLAGRYRFGVLPLGFVPQEHLLRVLSCARLCVLPSIYEGFGLSVLEAQTAGTPLACSNVASLPEVAGAGARYFDPLSVRDIALAIEACLGDRAYCDSLVRAGRKNITRFTWERTADQTMDAYKMAACVPEGARSATASI